MENHPEKTINILGVPVGVYDLAGIITDFEHYIEESGCATAYAVNTHSFNMTYRSVDHFEALKHSEIIYADGASILIAAKLLGKPLPERLCTTDLWPPMCEISQKKGYRFFLLGGPEGLTEETIAVTREKYPELVFAGSHHGFFQLDDERIVEIINNAQPDVIWVGMGDPRQTTWIEKHRKNLNVPLIITCGGMFGFLTGREKRAPAAIRNSGFEWLYRWFQGPVRLFNRYFFGLPAFGFRVLRQRFFDHRNIIR